jgi:hypothetical protein
MTDKVLNSGSVQGFKGVVRLQRMKPDYKQIRKQLNRALRGESGDSSYDGAVAHALKWVLGKSEAPY